MTYGPLQLRIGDEFDATDADSDLLQMINNASRVAVIETRALEAEPQAALLQPKPEPQPPTQPQHPVVTYKHRHKKRHYKRRDLTAEE